MNIKELAEMIGLPWTTIRDRKAGTNDIPRIKLGGRVLFSFNAVQSWMAQKAREAEEAKRRQDLAVIDMLSERRRRKKLIKDTITTIVNGGRCER